MRKTPLFPYIIEVVTDNDNNVISFNPELLRLLRSNADVRHLHVPDDYVLPNRSKYKARALHWALLNSPLPDDAWIVHLDEETQPTSSGIKGICKMIREEEITQRLRIGQGAILYHRAWRKYPILTLADNVRTGDDFARFHFQHRLGKTIFGLHGSFIVVRNDVEKESGGFDFGPRGDITEDAFWALIMMKLGRRCRWVEGYLEEQSCMSLPDFLRQRRRWWFGLANVSLFAPVALRWRVCLGVNTALWAFAPFSMIYTIAHFFYGFETSPIIHFLANYSYATFVVLYFMGLKANLDEGVRERWVRPVAYVLQALFTILPVFSAMESIGVLWALVHPPHGFHVVKK
jgi:egghead protein (zeste-white 4 protein)